MADELEKRWNKSYATSSLKYEHDRKLLGHIQKKKLAEKAYKKAEQMHVPYSEIVFGLIMCSRIYSAISGHITDCDETYNFWEPTHFLLYRSGFQTWEYNPRYALRSYCYVALHAIFAKIFDLISNHKVFVFYLIRMLLGTFTAISEDQFYSAVYRKYGKFIAVCWLVITLFSPGMYISSTAYLPSSFAMCSVTIAFAAWLDGYEQASVVWIALGALLGWPFVAVLGLPIVWDIVVRKNKMSQFAEYFFVALIFTITPIIIVDLAFYRKLIIAPLNILIYNVFNPHGSELYGTEPMSFYLANGFLNFNMAFVFALVSLPVYLLHKYFNKGLKDIGYLLTAMYMWFAIMFAAPHKEERFLYPVYTIISLAAAVVLYIIWRSTSACFGYFYRHMEKTAVVSVIGILGVYISLSLMRIAALEMYYQSPMHLYRDVYTIPEDKPVICLGKEWYRYPSSFFIPHTAHVRFIKSSFKGQLPQRYYPDSNGTYAINTRHNDANREEDNVYISIK